MPLSKKALLLILINSLFTILLIVFLIVKEKKESIVYIDNAKVFTQFNMSVEVKKTGEQEINYRSKIIDSLYRLIQSTNNDQTKELLVKEFALQKEDLENFSAGFSNHETIKIWDRIKSHAKDFSKENGYEFILGMQPNENIIYGSEAKDVTTEFITYLNKKYEGN